MSNAFIEQWLFHADSVRYIRTPYPLVLHNRKNRRFSMNEQKKSQPEQSGKQIALGIFGFIVGTIILIYLLKVFLF
jgi:hypothetical protein